MIELDADPGLRADRWLPVRAGVLNVWRYYDEVFEFHRGRLLLRGANGTGKSKALELLLPFLFDASLQPSRLSTFGGTERTMHWNLMGEGHSTTTRVGYVWLEFGRLDGAGVPQWFTCGARLAATAHARRVTPTYFTADLRVGHPDGLTLLKGGDVPLTRAELAAAVEGSGAIYDTPTGYRRVVRETLFRGLTDDQYDALINALLKLRTPKLSEHLDPEQLSHLLSDALPPLDQQDLAEIAEGFEKLDRQREDLARLDAEVTAAERLADGQRRYARRALRRAAADLVSATTVLDNVTRRARERRAEHERAVAERDQLLHQLTEVEAAEREAEHRIDGLRDSDAYREGQQLDQLRQQAAAARATADDAALTAQRRGEEATQDTQRAAELLAAAETARATAAAAYADLARLALQVGVGQLVEPLADQDPAQAAGPLRGIVTGREQQLREVRGALATAEAAQQARAHAEQWLARCHNDLEAGDAALAQAAADRQAAVAAHREAVADWARGTQLLPLVAHADDLADLAEDETALRDRIGQVATEVRDGLAREEQRLGAQRSDREAERGQRVAERDRLASQATLEPDPSPYRRADRSAAAGAPLWRLVDWRPAVPEPLHAPVEAALEASGLLDAWLYPDGSVHLPEGAAGHDIHLAAALARPAVGGSLADLLTPDPDSPVPPPVVAAVLAGIGYGRSAPEHVAAVGADGSWRLGPAYGRWGKPEAAYLGATARERARQRRLAALAAEIEALTGQLEALDADLAEVADRRAAVAAELAALPRPDRLRQARQDHERADMRVAEQRRQVTLAEQERDAAEGRARHQQQQLELLAGGYGLPATRTGLDEVAELVDALRQVGEAWLSGQERAGRDEQWAAEAGRRATRSQTTAEEAARTAADQVAHADGLATRLAAVEESVDAPYRAVLDEVAALRRRGDDLAAQRRRLGPRKDELLERIGGLARQVAVDEDERAAAVGQRDGGVDRLTALGRRGFGHDARVRVELAGVATTTAALEAARALASELDRTPYEPARLRESESQLAETMHTVSQHLAGHVDLSMEPDADCDVQVVTATVDGQRIGPAALVERLRAERDQVRSQLTEDERGLFDRTLTGDTRRHVADRIRQADGLVRAVSTQLEQVRTVSALRVRLVWQVDPERGRHLAQARDLLLRDPATLTDEEREALHEFFRAQIDEVRASGENTGWLRQLEEVLDYRRWHRFVVQMRTAGGEWLTVTRRQHGAKSGGEKAIVLHLPLFAAAAAHYRAAAQAPRLILLDEVFVGVDSTNRGQLMEVLAAFDLDLMLTSDTEWCTYPQLDGVAVHQLLAGEDGDDAVTTARFRWDGRRLLDAEPETDLDPRIPAQLGPGAVAADVDG